MPVNTNWGPGPGSRRYKHPFNYNTLFWRNKTFCWKRAICLKGDVWTFDGFQTKLLWKLEILENLLLLKFLFTWVIKTHNNFFCDRAFEYSLQTNINQWFFFFWGGGGELQKNMNCAFPLIIILSFRQIKLSVWYNTFFNIQHLLWNVKLSLKIILSSQSMIL